MCDLWLKSGILWFISNYLVLKWQGRLNSVVDCLFHVWKTVKIQWKCVCYYFNNCHVKTIRANGIITTFWARFSTHLFGKLNVIHECEYYNLFLMISNWNFHFVNCKSNVYRLVFWQMFFSPANSDPVFFVVFYDGSTFCTQMPTQCHICIYFFSFLHNFALRNCDICIRNS